MATKTGSSSNSTFNSGDVVMDFMASDHFAFNGTAFSGDHGSLGGAHDAPANLTLGVNFDSHLAPAAATDSNGWFLYHTDTGALDWDADGNGAGGATVVATHSNHFLLSAGDFLVVNL